MQANDFAARMQDAAHKRLMERQAVGAEHRLSGATGVELVWSRHVMNIQAVMV